MHYGIVWGERQRVFPQDFPLILYRLLGFFNDFPISSVYLTSVSFVISYSYTVRVHRIENVIYNDLYWRTLHILRHEKLLQASQGPRISIDALFIFSRRRTCIYIYVESF